MHEKKKVLNSIDDVDWDGGKTMIEKDTRGNKLMLFNRDSTIKSIQQTQKIRIMGIRMLAEAESDTK